MKAKPNYDYAYIKVELRHAGDFGMCLMSGVSYENDDHLINAAEQIKRHIDRVKTCDIEYDMWICSECESNYDTKKEAEDCCQINLKDKQL